MLSSIFLSLADICFRHIIIRFNVNGRHLIGRTAKVEMILNRFVSIFCAVFFAVLIGLSFPAVSAGQNYFLPGDLKRDGILRLYHSHHDEWLEVLYEKDGRVLETAIKKINHLMRSRQDGKELAMDIGLIRLLDHLQDHFGADTVEVICGYRSPQYNRFLKQSGRDVAEGSYHIKGVAVDIHMDEITEEKLVQYLLRLHTGGVGYYPDLLMVHADLGPGRFWQDGKFTGRLNIGEFNETLDLKLTTNELFYFLGDKQKLHVANPSAIPLRDGLQLEHFFRGRWGNSTQPSFICHREPLKLVEGGATIQMTQLDCFACARNDIRDGCADPIFGKYRWKAVTEDGMFQYSNEFYLKRM